VNVSNSRIVSYWDLRLGDLLDLRGDRRFEDLRGDRRLGDLRGDRRLGDLRGDRRLGDLRGDLLLLKSISINFFLVFLSTEFFLVKEKLGLLLYICSLPPYLTTFNCFKFLNQILKFSDKK
jgi:hypothetical protein